MLTSSKNGMMESFSSYGLFVLMILSACAVALNVHAEREGVVKQAAKLCDSPFKHKKVTRQELVAAVLEYYEQPSDLPMHQREPLSLCGIDLSGVDLNALNKGFAVPPRLNLSGSSLRKANLTEAKIHGSNLTGVDLSGADLTGTGMNLTMLKGVTLDGAILNQTILIGADLTGVDLRNVVLAGSVDLRGMTLDRADLSGLQLGGTEATRTMLNGSSLVKAKLRETNLTGAFMLGSDLTRARLYNATLIRADLGETKFIHANMSEVDLSGAVLSAADLTNAYMAKAIMINTEMSFATLTDATLTEANLTSATLRSANLENARLMQANLSSTELIGANLSGADLREANLQGARLNQANLDKTIFEPQSDGLPSIADIALAKNLSSMRFADNPQGLVLLKKAFQKAGFRRQEREITHAIQHTRVMRVLQPQTEHAKNQISILARIEAVFQYVFFDLTTRWGMEPGRALSMLLVLIPLFAIPYAIALRIPGKDGIWRHWIDTRSRKDLGQDEPEKIQVGWFAAMRFGTYFSVLSAFHFGWRELNLGNWIARLQPREYTLNASGWVRAVSGTQSLISLYLVAIWALTYFGRPFE
jgi:uncharacterized protein YjbI with pentapeptide repeats